MSISNVKRKVIKYNDCYCCTSLLCYVWFWMLELHWHLVVGCLSLLLTDALFPHRYQYYLQLKKDVLEGRISCSLEQAIRLASLAVQGKWWFKPHLDKTCVSWCKMLCNVPRKAITVAITEQLSMNNDLRLHQLKQEASCIYKKYTSDISVFLGWELYHRFSKLCRYVTGNCCWPAVRSFLPKQLSFIFYHSKRNMLLFFLFFSNHNQEKKKWL